MVINNQARQVLKGRVVLVTGGNTETGQATALALARAGAWVALAGGFEEELSRVVEVIEAGGGMALALPGELTSEQAVADVIERVTKRYQAPDALVAAGAFWAGGAIHEHRVDAWTRGLSHNLTSAFLLTRAVLPAMRVARRGDVIFLSSQSGSITYATDGVYGVSLHGLAALAEQTRAENAELGIRVITLSTGVPQTNYGGEASPGYVTPEDIAETVVWLLSRRKELSVGGVIQLG